MEMICFERKFATNVTKRKRMNWSNYERKKTRVLLYMGGPERELSLKAQVATREQEKTKSP